MAGEETRNQDRAASNIEVEKLTIRDAAMRQRAAKKVANEVLETLRSDPLFNSFDAKYWSTAAATGVTDGGPFVERTFPLLAKYCNGEVLCKLAAGYQWLAGLVIPSKRHEAARAFQGDPAHNLTILDVFVKLQFLHVWDLI